MLSELFDPSFCLREPLSLALGVLVILCVAARFCAVWLAPVFRHGYETFVPVRYAPGQLSDDYFYFARIRDLIDGDLLNTDPLLLENKHRPHTHSTYQLSLWFCALPGLFKRDTIHAFIGTMALYPALQFAALASLGWLCTGSAGVGLLAASAAYYPKANRDLERVPNTLFTGLHLALAGLLCWELLYQPPSLAVNAALVLVVGASPVVSMANMLFCIYMILGLALHDLQAAWNAPWLYLACMAAALPPALWSQRNIRAGKDLYPFGNICYLGDLNKAVRTSLLRYLAAPAAVYALQALCFGVHAYFYGMVFVTAALCFLTAWLQSGNIFAANLTLIRGSVTLTLLVGVLNAYHLVAGTAALLAGWAGAGEIPWAMPAAGAVCATAALALAGRKALQALRAENARAGAPHDREFRQLADWSKTLSPKDVILTLDFDVNTSLPVYTPACFYVPQAMLSTALEDEIWQRMFEACRFLGVSFPALMGFLAKSVPHYLIDHNASLTQYGLASLDLTYLKYSSNWGQGFNMPQEAVAERGLQYKRLLAEPRALSFKASVVVVSTAQVLGANLHAKLGGFPGVRPLFANSRYAAYRLDAATLAA
ncbi:MAG: hypothetical protein ACLGQW_10000, partial [Acidobacteriota bacterium]